MGSKKLKDVGVAQRGCFFAESKNHCEKGFGRINASNSYNRKHATV